ncbi:MAG TPA: heavy metal-binding domain-containing protein [Polyangiaceae bacterium]|nr:heavy metal-binding domain-containing protein [Polyangiaceae bacterium]
MSNVLSCLAGLLAGLSLLGACAGDPLPPSRSQSDPSNPSAPEAPASETPAPATPLGSTMLPAGPAMPSAPHDHAAMLAAEASRSDAGVVYTCPMHPEVQSNAPGKCPKCGMTLVPKKP